MTVTYKFEQVRDQRDQFVVMMDMQRYGMFNEAVEIGPFSMTAFLQGIFVRGPAIGVEEFVQEFEGQLRGRKYKKTVAG